MKFKELQLTPNDPNVKKIACYISFNEAGKIKRDFIKEAFEFSYLMTFGKSGEHRNHRSGGTHQRRNGEIFANTLQGKLCEFAIYQELFERHEINKPDLSVYELGKWDSWDFQIKGKTISIKSTKSFGQLLLLESKDWTTNGEYIPNGKETYHYIFMVRLKNDPETIMRQNKIFFSDSVDKSVLWKLFENNDWSYDIPRYITHQELVFLINNGFIIHKGDLLNGKTKMDADNYYCHLYDMHPLNKEFL
jgi:hypothetical protein